MTKLPFALFVLIISTVPFFVTSQFSPADRSVLLSLKKAWGNPPNLQSWNATSSPCHWLGIHCAGDGSVAALRLRDYGLTGTIPASISTLQNLTVLDLAYNLFPGGFPTTVLNCFKLEVLDLSQNLFVGSIPVSIGHLRLLRYLDLSANNFSGDVPQAIGNLTQLRTLYLQSNLFNGSYPMEISNLVNLENLGLAYNAFSPAVIPPEFGELENINYIWMTKANVIGGIPRSFENLSNLTHLDLSRNQMEGEIPTGLLQLKKLSKIYLFNNRFSGSIPQVIGSLNLVDLDLSINNLTGRIPEDFGKLQNLQLLNLFDNQLDGEIPPSIGLIPSLKNFRIFKNNLSGILPPELGKHSNLEAIEISDNQLTGNLPESLCAGGTLFGVVGFNNKFTGEIPTSLSDCQSLRTLQLYGNNFTGRVPLGIWSVLNMTSLQLSDNAFSGELPTQVAWNLTRLEIRNNQFTGGIPAEVSSWEKMVVFEASDNMFSGQIPVELTSLDHLTTLLLDGNSLSGEFPSEIVSWRSLTALNLSGNRLSGSIPIALSALPGLLDLDLSRNQFVGKIPPQLGHLKLTSLNLSSNRLTGRIPDAFDNLAFEYSFLDNLNLCGARYIPSIRICDSSLRGSKKMSPRILAMVLILVATSVMILVLLARFLVRRYRRRQRNREIVTWKLTSFQRLDFTEVTIVSSLVESNMIGSGSSGEVYKIKVDHGGEYVAVKRIWSKKNPNHELEKEFLAEIQTLSSVRHSNIIKLICWISSNEMHLLVYEYMENQSVDKWLHGKKRKGLCPNTSIGNIVLDWPTRLQIAVGAAQGLCYMHHDCTPPIIHRDVKSSNILLDSNFEAKIADFGLAKILIKHNEAHTVSAIAGSFGYIAPEYAYTTKVNIKIDVYSFGVVLLELVTGREANCGDEDSNLAEWIWKNNGQENPMIDVIDEEIKESQYLEDMLTVLKLGIMCTSPIPRNRPSMREVLQILQRCKSLCDGRKMGGERDISPLLGDAKYISSYHSKMLMDGGNSSLDSLV